jgi:predicted O-linked N-acetylglucosamine transferase (SPINDLY family)
LLLHAKQGAHRQRLRDLLVAEGVDPQRVEFAAHVPIAEYFQLYHRIDIGLDPFPYTGGTTTCDALYMGVPVITLAGDRAVFRGGLSLLSNIQLGDLVATDPDQYIDIASTLAGDVERLSSLRSTLRDRMLHSPLMDAPRFARNMEKAYRTMWRAWCASLKPS